MSSTFYETLLTTAKERYKCTIFIILICVCFAVADSIFFERYCSSALILIPAHDDSIRFDQRTFDVETNERFLATQQSIIISEKVLKDSLVASIPDNPISPQMIDSLKQHLYIERLPFNNTMTLHLRGSDPSQTKQILSTIIKSYKKWFQAIVTTEAVRIRESLQSNLENQQMQFASAEQALNSFNEEHEAFFLAERYIETTGLLDDINDWKRRSKQRIAWLEKTQSMLNSTDYEGIGSTISECLQQADPLYFQQNSLLNENDTSVLDAKKYFESSTIIGYTPNNDKMREVVITCILHAHAWLPKNIRVRLVYWMTSLIALATEKSYINQLNQLTTVIQEFRREFIHIEQQLKPLTKEIELANDAIRQTLKQKRKVELYLARNSQISVEILTPPTESVRLNPLFRNIIYGLAFGLPASFLLVYLFALRKSEH